MPGLEESATVWRYLVQDPSRFDKKRVKDISAGVKITLGRIKGSERWEIENYMFEKAAFRAREDVRKWLDSHLKGEIRSFLDFRAFDEWKRRFVNAYVNISKVE